MGRRPLAPEIRAAIAREHQADPDAGPGLIARLVGTSKTSAGRVLASLRAAEARQEAPGALVQPSGGMAVTGDPVRAAVTGSQAWLWTPGPDGLPPPALCGRYPQRVGEEPRPSRWFPW